MKKVLYILALFMTVAAYAQQNAPQQEMGKCYGDLPGYPYYYCECTNNAIDFAFPLKVQVSDTIWYVTTVDAMKQGLCAYWFSDASITFEIYPWCSGKVPSFSMTVGPNQMREMDINTINRKLDEMGNMAELMAMLLTPRIRVYPNGGGTGTVYCYPYDQGPRSTCAEPLPLIPRMTYVCDTTEEVYELKPEKINANGYGFIRWKQKDNMAGTIRLTEGSCSGPEIGSATLTDSMRVYVLDSIRLKAAKQAGHSVFVHVTHPEGYVGRIMYRNVIRWDRQIIDTTLCQGMRLQLADTVLKETTYYPNDTLWKGEDTLALTAYNLTVTPPTAVYDTLRLKSKQLPTTYRNQQRIPAEGWGDYDFTIHVQDGCDERYLLHVEHNYVTKEVKVDTILCSGKTIKVNNVTYSKDTVINDSVWTYAPASGSTPDTYTIRNISIHFAEPDMEYDTISVLPSKMTSRGYWYSDLGVMVKYGDTLIVKKRNNTCTRYIQLHVDRDVVIAEGDTDTTLCVGKTVIFNDVAYTTDTAFYDTIQVDADTWQRGMIRIRFEALQTEYDTLVLDPLQTEVPFGDTLLVVEAEDQCTRWIQRHVTFDNTPIVTMTDTTLCLGKTMTFGGITYAADTMIYDSAWIEPGLWMINTITMHFAEPEMEYDTIRVAPEQMIPAGDTLIVLTEENECTRWIMQHVELTEGIDNPAASSDGVYKYMHNGILYIRREGKDYDLVGRPINRQ